jgi:hypothetical protein
MTRTLSRRRAALISISAAMSTAIVCTHYMSSVLFVEAHSTDEYTAQLAPRPSTLQECYLARMYPQSHEHRAQDHHTESAQVSDQWGPVHTTPWTEWAERIDGTGLTEFTPCSTAGVREVSTLIRHRNESMHTAFVPSLDYDIRVDIAGRRYRMGLLRNLSSPTQFRWRLAFVADMDLAGDEVVADAQELLFLPDVSFHDELVRQSAHNGDPLTLPIGRTLLMTHSGRTTCPHATYGLASAPIGTLCEWDFEILDEDTHWQLLSPLDLAPGLPQFGIQARVTHSPHTIHNGSLLSVIGVDLRARYVTQTSHAFDPMDVSPTAPRFTPQAQLAADLQLTAYLGEPLASGFVPPLTMKVQQEEPRYFLQAMTPESTRSPHPKWSLHEHQHCATQTSALEMSAALVAPDPDVVCYVRLEDRQRIQPTTLVRYSVVSDAVTVSLHLRVDPAVAGEPTVQVILDMSHFNLLRVEYVRSIEHLVAWVGLPGVSSDECTVTKARSLVVVYRGGEPLADLEMVMHTVDPDGSVPAHYELPRPCHGDPFAVPVTSLCDLRTLHSGCYQDSGTSDTFDSVTLFGRRGRFVGWIQDVEIWDRRLTAHEAHAWAMAGLQTGSMGSALSHDGTVSSVAPTNLGDLAWYLDCRPDIVRGTVGVAWANSYGGIRCVARSLRNSVKEIDFIPILLCHPGCNTSHPYMCTDDVCVASPDGCELRSSAESVVSHAPCPELSAAMTAGQSATGTSSQQLSSELHRVVTTLIRRVTKERMHMTMKSPTTLAYDDVNVQVALELDSSNPVPSSAYSTGSSKEWTVMLIVHTHRDHTVVPFALGGTTYVTSTDDRDVDLDSHCHEFLEPVGTGAEYVPVDKRACADGTIVNRPSEPWHCAGTRLGTRLCPSARPYRCGAATPLTFAHDPTVGGLTLSQYRFSNGAVSYQSTNRGTSRAELYFDALAGAVDHIPSVQVVVMTVGFELETALGSVGHPDIRAYTGVVGGHVVLADKDTTLGRIAATRLSQTVLYFARVSSNRSVDAVWTRAQAILGTDLNADGYPLQFTTTLAPGVVPITVYRCVAEDGGAGQTGEWLALLYTVAELAQAPPGFDPGCQVYGIRFPAGMGVSLSDDEARELDWDGVGQMRTPFPVYNDYHCVSTSSGCPSGLAVCDRSTVPNEIQSTFHQVAHSTVRTEVGSRSALCAHASMSTHGGLAEITGFYSGGRTDMSEPGLVWVNVTGHLVTWSLCPGGSSLCDGGSYDPSSGVITPVVAGLGYVTLTDGVLTIDTQSGGETTYTHIGTVPMRPCNMSDVQQMIICDAPCTRLTHRFKLATFTKYVQRLCLTLVPNVAGRRTVDLSWSPCDPRSTGQTLRFRRIDFQHGRTQLEFDGAGGACLAIRDLLGHKLMVVDYACEQWDTVRFLQEGVLVDSDDRRLYSRMLADTVYDTFPDSAELIQTAWPMTLAYSVQHDGTVLRDETYGLPINSDHFEPVLEIGASALPPTAFNQFHPPVSTYGDTSFGVTWHRTPASRNRSVVPVPGAVHGRNWAVVRHHLATINQSAQGIWQSLPAPQGSMVVVSPSEVVRASPAISLSECQRRCELTIDCWATTWVNATGMCTHGRKRLRSTQFNATVTFGLTRGRSFQEAGEDGAPAWNLTTLGALQSHLNQPAVLTTTLVVRPAHSTPSIHPHTHNEVYTVCLAADYRTYPAGAYHSAAMIVERNSFPYTTPADHYRLRLRDAETGEDPCAVAGVTPEGHAYIRSRIVRVPERCVPRLHPGREYRVYARRADGHTRHLFLAVFEVCYGPQAIGFVHSASVRVSGSDPIGQLLSVHPPDPVDVHFTAVARPSPTETYEVLSTIPVVMVPAHDDWRSLTKEDLLDGRYTWKIAVESPVGSYRYTVTFSTADLDQLRDDREYVVVAQHTWPGTYMKVQLGAVFLHSATPTCAAVRSNVVTGHHTLPTLTDHEQFWVNVTVTRVGFRQVLRLAPLEPPSGPPARSSQWATTVAASLSAAALIVTPCSRSLPCRLATCARWRPRAHSSVNSSSQGPCYCRAHPRHRSPRPRRSPSGQCSPADARPSASMPGLTALLPSPSIFRPRRDRPCGPAAASSTRVPHPPRTRTPITRTPRAPASRVGPVGSTRSSTPTYNRAVRCASPWTPKSLRASRASTSSTRSTCPRPSHPRHSMTYRTASTTSSDRHSTPAAPAPVTRVQYPPCTRPSVKQLVPSEAAVYRPTPPTRTSS